MGFDVMLEVYANDTASATVGLDDLAKASYVSDVTNICLVLAHADRLDELEQALVQVEAEVASRRLPELIDRVRKSIPKT